MNFLLCAASIWLPPPLRRKAVEELFRITAESFGEDPPVKSGSAPDSSLEDYAVFTRRLVDKSIDGERDMAAVRKALRRRAVAFGERLRLQFRLRSRKDALRLLELAYKSIGIALEADAEGRIIVSRCFFSPHYTPETCRVIAALDEGIMAGILGDGNLEFEERITEGQSRCRAVFRGREGRRQ